MAFDFKIATEKLKEEEGEELFTLLKGIFIKRTPTDLQELEKALTEKDLETIRSKSHLLAGTFSSIKFDEGYKLAKNVESLASEGDSERAYVATEELIIYLKSALEYLS